MLATETVPDGVLRKTTGVCPECLERVPADVAVSNGQVCLVKHCDQDGDSSQLLSKHPDYWGALDKFYFSINSREYPQRDFIVRMTEHCNLDCPICLAKANTEETEDLDLSGLEELLTHRRGIKIDLMAAEPTLRKDLEDWIRKVKASGNIAALHTNGIRMADKAFAKRIKDAGVDEVFLQFDGFNEEAHMALRGRKLVETRMKAMENLRELNIGTSLIVVIARDLNEEQVGEVFRFALRPENEHIREVFFMGLRLLGSARDAARSGKTSWMQDQQLMPDELIDLLCEQEPRITRHDVFRFNQIYFAMLSAFQVKKCLYIQHYLVTRDGEGGYTPVADILKMDGLGQAAERYAEEAEAHPVRARAKLAASVVREGMRPAPIRMAGDFLRLERLFQSGMNLQNVPRRFLLLGFITACDPYNFDAQVAINCGKGELSADGGFTESSACANVDREARFEASDRRPGERRRKAKQSVETPEVTDGGQVEV